MTNLLQQRAQEQKHTYGPVSIAPFGVARIGGIPAGQLDKLHLYETTRSIRFALEAEQAMQAIGPQIEEALYRLVPLVGDDKELRRRILAVKRNVHNLRMWPEAASDIEQVADALGEEAHLLRAWFRMAREREHTLQKASVTYEQELHEAMQALARSIQQPELQQGLALVSPSLLEELTRPLQLQDWRPTSKLARSSLSYLTRAALKTSPLSTFTHLAVVHHAPEKEDRARIPQAAQTEPHRHVRLVRMLPAALLMQIAYSPELAPALQFEPNAGLCHAGSRLDKVRVLTSEYTVHDDFAWRRESTVERRFDRERLPALAGYLESGRPISYAQLIQLLTAGKPATNVHKVVTQLLDMQLLKPIAPYSRRDPEPIAALAATLEKLNSPLAIDISSRMRHVQALVKESHAASGPERLRLLERIRQESAAIFLRLGSSPPAWLATCNLLYEDVQYSGPAITLNRHIEEDLARVATILRPSIIRGKLYDYLYRYFIERFGSDGETNDILGFLEDFLAREDATELLTRAMMEDRVALQRPGGGRCDLPSGASAMPPAVTIFYQLVAESEEALERGDYKLVVNQVCPGQGGLLGRFAGLLGDGHGNLDELLSSWVASLHEDGEAMEMPVVGDWSNLQGEIGVTRQTLRWPAELSNEGDGERTRELRELRLRANPNDETLYFIDAQGKVIAPLYLGVVPTHLISHAVRLFLMLLDPWVSDYPVGWNLHRFSQRDTAPTEIEYFARVEEGRVILRRARWRIPVDQVPIRQKGESDFDFFVRVQRWQREHNLPDEVFASSERAQLTLQAKARKPVWISFSSPHTLELLRQLLDKDVLAINLTEALPNRHQHWVQPDPQLPSSRHVSEFMALARWPSPQKEQPATAFTRRTALEHDRDNWLFFKIYPARSDQVDQVVTHIVQPAIESARFRPELQRWFFTRYMDKRGWHIRLRLQGPSDLREALRGEIGNRIEQTLPQLAYDRAHHLLPANLLPQPVMAEPGYVLAEYEPEYEKYGGKAGVAIAERLFQASSEVALQALLLESGAKLDRILLSLLLMRLMAETVYTEPEARARFWNQYLWYWSGQDRSGAAELRASFKQGAASRCAFLSRQLAEIAAHPLASRLIDSYREAFLATLEALAGAGDQVAEPASGLCFDYMHMNNNRLGILPLEESYLAALLLEIERGGILRCTQNDMAGHVILSATKNPSPEAMLPTKQEVPSCSNSVLTLSR
ncbi:MAG TPA: thiopeptide-type bacteriocin biosynthesis protein [Ktedonobacteraceae bacterium]|nr:thiopeptide-type bacteriocin biosynthesis protein [Ktedonobacteraceae bacterium]